MARTGRRWVAIGAWLVIVVLAMPFASRQSEHLSSGGYAVAGSESAHADAALARAYPQVNAASLAFLLWPQQGASAAQMRDAVHAVQRAVHGIADLTLPIRARELALFSAGLSSPIVMPLEVHGNEARAQEIAEHLRSKLGATPGAAHVQIHVLGEGALWAGLNEVSKRELAHAELVGFPTLFVVLLAIFGSVAAAALPLALGAVAVLVTGALIYLLSLAVSLSVFVTNTASMLGIGVAVDYSLIILARMRQELAGGLDTRAALRVALDTSGRAVAFSGATVAASLLGIFVIPIGTVRSMALGAIVVVAVSVLASVTLLPALMQLMGRERLLADGLRGHAARLCERLLGSRPRRSGWERWTRAVTDHPVAAIIGAGALLGLACVPALSMRTGTGALEQLSARSDTRVGFSEAATLEGRGGIAPTYVVLSAGERDRRMLVRTAQRQRTVALRVHGVAQVEGPTVAAGGTDALLVVRLGYDPESAAAKRTVRSLRSALHTSLRGSGAAVAVGGTTATQFDEQHAVMGSMWKLFAAVLALAFVVLLIGLRSLLLPLKAILFNLLSVGAAYGVLVAVFQWGWFDALTGYRSLGHLDTFTPPLILAIVFGLSMDYEVFLLTRIRERWLQTGDSRLAVSDGLIVSARTITSAALILVCVFAVFVGTGTPSVKELGLGAAVAIAIDASLVRLILVPATMALLGDWSWWLPGVARRWAPRAAVAELTTRAEA